MNYKTKTGLCNAGSNFFGDIDDNYQYNKVFCYNGETIELINSWVGWHHLRMKGGDADDSISNTNSDD
ncbi:hypothetical protein GCM10027286_13540 [Virgibacillus ainsalahensis]